MRLQRIICIHLKDVAGYQRTRPAAPGGCATTVRNHHAEHMPRSVMRATALRIIISKNCSHATPRRLTIIALSPHSSSSYSRICVFACLLLLLNLNSGLRQTVCQTIGGAPACQLAPTLLRRQAQPSWCWPAAQHEQGVRRLPESPHTGLQWVSSHDYRVAHPHTSHDSIEGTALCMMR